MTQIQSALNKATQDVNTNDLRPVSLQSITPQQRKEIAKKAGESRKRAKTLREHALLIGGELVEFADDLGDRRIMTLDAAIMFKFARKVLAKPTPANVLAWQKLKGEDVQRIAVDNDTTTATTDELKAELALLLNAVNYKRDKANAIDVEFEEIPPVQDETGADTTNTPQDAPKVHVIDPPKRKRGRPRKNAD